MAASRVSAAGAEADTDQVITSRVPGSVATGAYTQAVPSGAVVTGLLVIVGATLSTTAVSVVLSVPPSPSSTVAVTV